MTTRGSLPGIQWSECEADHSPVARDEVKNEWSYTSNPPRDFTASRRQALHKHLNRPYNKKKSFTLTVSKKKLKDLATCGQYKQTRSAFHRYRVARYLDGEWQNIFSLSLEHLLTTRQLSDN